MVKGIGSTCPIPSLPLNSVLYVLDSPFNIISISKLSLKASFISPQPRLPPFTLPWMLLFLSIAALIILAFPSSGRWFLAFLAYLQLSVSRVSLGNMPVSSFLSAKIPGPSLLLSLSILIFGSPP